jgi:hypothetical protein
LAALIRVEPDEGGRDSDRGGPGRLGMELLNALLDLADATSAAIGIVAFWYTWVAPPRRPALPPPRRPSPPDELDRFVHAATLRSAGDTVA